MSSRAAAQVLSGLEILRPGVDISRLASLCDAEEFAELVVEMVANEAPRLFAVVQEYGERVDGRIAHGAWLSKTAPRSSASREGPP